MDYPLSTPLDFELLMLAISYYWADFSLIYHLTNQNSTLYRAISNEDAPAIRNFYERNAIDFDQFTDKQKSEFDAVYNDIAATYRNQLETQKLPLPDDYLARLRKRAIEKGNYTAAHAVLNITNQLEKVVNEYIVKGIEQLHSKEIKSLESGESSSNLEQLDDHIREAVRNFYIAIRVKNPFGNHFQYLAPDLFMSNKEQLKKYYKYIEMSLLKEIIEFAIEFLVQDKVIAEKIISNLQSAKLRKLFLNHLARQFSLGEQNYDKFIARYKQSVSILKEAKNETDFLNVQRTLLGRGTGDNEFYQYLRELAFEQPISSLMCAVTVTEEGTPYFTPILLKSGQSLLEFLELDK
ncbi:hypothetical protein JXB12_02885 [candidate division KSB1 bacterium]|nr:hypothetical protein [candidate division KSB1 bacterium]